MNDRVRTAAVLAGAALLVMAALAGFGNLVVIDGLVTPGDPAATAREVSASEGLFRLGVASLYLVVVLDVVVAWALLRVFRPVNAELSRLGAWLRWGYAAVFMVAISQLAGVPALLNGSDGTGAYTAGQVQTHAMFQVSAFHDIWAAGLILFGAHLIVVGYLAYRSGFVPRLIGVLLVIAGVGYTFDSFVTVLTDEAVFEISSVTFLGEFLFAVWLLIRGRHITVVAPPRV